jgi:very-short-patch-repair endonuclease
MEQIKKTRKSGPRKYLTSEMYIDALRKVNTQDLDFSKIEYKGQDVKVFLTCNICKFEFYSDPGDLMAKNTGCPECRRSGLRNVGKRKILPWMEIERRAIEIHGGKYSYLKDSYISMTKKMKILCAIHGEFEQIVGNHLAGAGCPTCARLIIDAKRTMPEAEVFTKASIVHKDKYSYVLGSYISMNKPIEILCNKHGLFTQIAGDHMDGHGCPRCGKIFSGPQESISAYIKELGVEVVDNFVMGNHKHLDIVCPKEKIAFEYNGLMWHSEEYNKDVNYHLEKTIQAKSQGYRLIHIFGDELEYFPEKVFNFIKTVLGKNEIKYDARKLVLDVSVPWNEAKTLLDKVHLQNSGPPVKICVGLRDPISNELLSVMTFDGRNVKDDEFELIRFCSMGRVRGAFSKLLKATIPILNCKKIISFSETRLSEGSVYSINGFKQDSIVEPRYWYVKERKRIHRRAFQKQYLEKQLKVYDPNLTEKENCEANGYYRIWDCGKIKWVLEV